MRLSTVALIIAGLTGAIVLAQPMAHKPPVTTTECVDPGGREMPATCEAPGRGDGPCACPKGAQPIKVAVCAKDQNPPADGEALNLVRREAIRDGSLEGDTVNGQPICVLPRSTPRLGQG